MHDHEQRVLIFSPKGRDAEISSRILSSARIPCETCHDVAEVCRKIEEGAGALLTTAEALDLNATGMLERALAAQAPWSELPVMMFVREEGAELVHDRLGPRAHVTLLDRPIHIKTLVSVAQSSLRSRVRQYEIRDLMDRLEQRVQERDRFLAILGHELRNPLGAILLASQLVDQETETLEGAHARVIERQSRHLTRLVNDLLDLSRVASGKIVLKTQRVNLREIAWQTFETLHESARAHEVKVDFDSQGPPLMLDADPVRLDQIIGNLLTNAIKYTPAGGTVIVRFGVDRGFGFLEIQDDGVGIAADRLGRIFELFAQAENAIGRSQGGMGIGLALVRNLVDLHDGIVTAKSDGEGRGSTFRVAIPLAAEVENEPPAAREQTVSRRSRRIVLIEDNPDLRELMRIRLGRLGHEVRAVGDGHTGVRAVLDLRPDVALIDIGLPGIDGYEVASRLRNTLGHEVFLVAISGFGLPEDKRRAYEAGFDEHLTKPAEVRDIEQLLARIDAGDEPREAAV